MSCESFRQSETIRQETPFIVYTIETAHARMRALREPADRPRAHPRAAARRIDRTSRPRPARRR
ncbi:hypothetical protein GCM10010393_40990 [Streptomyces gobitricini]|uniref:Uncharacterized protein n=1 Tax=Streptomyces gobitricini TaxID=68211 RepID=A0ABN3MPX1_9ACTN